MIIFAVLLLSLAVALARGGSIYALGTLRVRFLWLFFVPLLLQLVIFTPLARFLGSDPGIPRLVYLVSMALGALALLLNRHLPGVLPIGVGLVSNLLVIALNGGFMPVSAAAREFAGMSALDGRDNNVIPMTPGTVLWFLGDILPLPAWVPLANVFSVGDVLIALGGAYFIQRALVLPPAPKTETRTATPRDSGSADL